MREIDEQKNQDLYDNDEYELENQNPEAEMEAKVRQVKENLADSLMKKRNEAVEFRVASGVEREWRKSESLFDAYGEDKKTSMLDYATGESRRQAVKGPKRSTVVVNIIRGRCEQAEGRFADIQLPVDDKNWGFKETPVPTIVKALEDKRPAAQGGVPLQKQDGSPVTISDVAEKDKEKIQKKMKGMETEVNDQLTECSYNSESRKVIRSAIRTGTGILKGPNVVKQTRKAWVPERDDMGNEAYMLQIQEKLLPSSIWVDNWKVYPSPDASEEGNKASYIWEKSDIKPSELRDLAGLPGYFADTIKEILQEEPVRTNLEPDRGTKKEKVQLKTISLGGQYERWEYYGDLNRDDLEILGHNLDHDDISQSFSAFVVFVNEKPIKVELNTLDTGDMPYDFFQWTPVNDAPWGVGIPSILTWLQEIINAAFRAMMDNAGDSSGANVVVNNSLYPADGKWEITGKKIWKLLQNSDGDDVRKAFSQFQIQNNQVELQNIIELALRFVDVETSMPQIFQGEKQEMPKTLGATNIIVDSSNVTLRSRVKAYDDQITVPHITRYYHWNMQYNEKPEIKGDFNVNARGTSVLYEKDQHSKTLLQIMAMKQDPDFAMRVDWDKAVKQLLSALKLDIAKPDDQVAKDKEAMAQQKKPKDPRIEAATIKVTGDMEKAKMVNDSDMKEIEAKGKFAEIELLSKMEEAERERQHDMQMKQMDYQMKMMEFSQTKGISLDKIKSDLSRDSMKLRTQIDLSKGKPAPQVATPAIEPGGRAKQGEAFQA